MSTKERNEHVYGMYQNLSKCIWFLEIRGKEGKHTPLLSTELTGFSVGDGIIMTCAHSGWAKYVDLEIKAKPMGTNSKYKATVIKSKPNWDIVLLRISDSFLEGITQSVKFGNGTAEAGDTIMMIGHPATVFVSSLFIGYVAYPCINMDDHCNELYTDRSKTLYTCKKFSWPNFAEFPTCRLMGHACNIDYWKDAQEKAGIVAGRSKRKMNDRMVGGNLDQVAWEQLNDNKMTKKSDDFHKSLHPLVPVVQILPYAIEPGCSGSPVFNIHGEVIGMCVYAESNIGMYGVHVSALRTFFNKVMLEEAGGHA